MAAGFFELPDASIARTFCRGYRRFYELCPLPEYDANKPLYPSGKLVFPNIGVIPQYCRQYDVFFHILEKKNQKAAELFREFDKLHNDIFNVSGLEEVRKYNSGLDGWNHSALNFKEITAHGLNAYEKRILAMKDEDLCEALLDVFTGIRTLHFRCVT